MARVKKKKKIKKRRVRKYHKVQKRKKKRIKILYGRIFLTLAIIIGLICVFFLIIGYRIKNITVTGNQYLTDQEIIEMAGLQNYPSTFTSLIIPTKQKLEKESLIKKATVTKNGLYKIYIKVEENRPLFYNLTSKKTVLLDGKKVHGQLEAPVLVNYVPDNIYDRFLTKMSLIDIDIIKRISEIEYKPNDVDKNRFLLAMQDGNYVYLTLGRFKNINEYVDIIKKFENKKGILYLDSGEYFKVYEG